MAFYTKAGSFDLNNSTGNQAVTGLGFTPKVILFFGVDDLGSFTVAADAVPWIGAATDSSHQWVIQASCEDAQATMDTYRASRPDACIMSNHPENGAANFEATFVSNDADGFTVNVTDAPVATVKVCFFALGGDDITNVFAGSKDLGHFATDVSVTGVGFQPDLVLFGSINTGVADVDSTYAELCFGAAISNAQQNVVAISSADGGATSVTNRYHRVDRCLAGIMSDSVIWDASFTSQDADGFTVTTTASPEDTYAFFVAIKGDFNTSITHFDKPATTENDETQAVTGVGFEPSAMLMYGVQRAVNASAISTHLALTLGAASALDEIVNMSVLDPDNKADAISDQCLNNDRIHDQRSTSDFSTVFSGELVSFDSDGYTLNWTLPSAGIPRISTICFAEIPTLPDWVLAVIDTKAIGGNFAAVVT